MTFVQATYVLATFVCDSNNNNCRFIKCDTSYNNIKVRLSFTTIFLISYVTMLNFALKLEFSALPGKVYFIFFICSHVMAVVVVATNNVTS